MPYLLVFLQPCQQLETHCRILTTCTVLAMGSVAKMHRTLLLHSG
jgi:hypothetical protein